MNRKLLFFFQSFGFILFMPIIYKYIESEITIKLSLVKLFLIILLSIFVTVLFEFVRSFKVKKMINLVNTKSHLKQIIICNLLGYPLAFFSPGGLGDIIRVKFWQKYFKIDLKEGLLLFAIERINMFSMFFFLSMFGFYMLPNYNFHLFFSIMFLILFFFTEIISLSIISKYFLKRKSNIKKALSMLVQLFFFDLILVLLLILQVYIVLHILDQSLSNILLIVGFSVGNILSIIPISLGGIGLREYTSNFLVSHLGSQISIFSSMLLSQTLNQIIISLISTILFYNLIKELVVVEE